MNRTLSSPVGAAPVTLRRVRLRSRWTAAEVMTLLSSEALPFTLTGDWAGGGTIAGSAPLSVAGADDDPFALLDALPALDPEAAAGAAGAVGGGWFGWLGYRLAARVEDVPLTENRPVKLPDFHLAYYDNVLHQDGDGRWWFEALVTNERREALQRRCADLADALFGAPPAPGDVDPEGPPGGVPPPFPLRLSAAAAAHHLHAVAETRRRITAGEIFQANICLRLEGRYPGTATDLLAAALAGPTATPPFTAAFATPHGCIVSFSPELFLRRQGQEIVTGPIKGTVPRPADPEQAGDARAGLLASVKDAAEHVMIVDLMRNDLGRVAAYGSVQAPRHPVAEAHPGVWHLVSHVHGRLRTGVGNGDVLQATFPPGSVTGAPKVQSLRVIAELEPTGREVYTGAIGFASPAAGLELSVAIRTLELAEGRLWLGAGGGIVADSDPETELAEALAKARPIAAAVGAEVIAEDPAGRTAEEPAGRPAGDGAP